MADPNEKYVSIISRILHPTKKAKRSTLFKNLVDVLAGDHLCEVLDANSTCALLAGYKVEVSKTWDHLSGMLMSLQKEGVAHEDYSPFLVDLLSPFIDKPWRLDRDRACRLTLSIIALCRKREDIRILIPLVTVEFLKMLDFEAWYPLCKCILVDFPAQLDHAILNWQYPIHDGHLLLLNKIVDSFLQNDEGVEFINPLVRLGLMVVRSFVEEVASLGPKLHRVVQKYLHLESSLVWFRLHCIISHNTVGCFYSKEMLISLAGLLFVQLHELRLKSCSDSYVIHLGKLCSSVFLEVISSRFQPELDEPVPKKRRIEETDPSKLADWSKVASLDFAGIVEDKRLLLLRLVFVEDLFSLIPQENRPSIERGIKDLLCVISDRTSRSISWMLFLLLTKLGAVMLPAVSACLSNVDMSRTDCIILGVDSLHSLHVPVKLGKAGFGICMALAYSELRVGAGFSETFLYSSIKNSLERGQIISLPVAILVHCFCMNCGIDWRKFQEFEACVIDSFCRRAPYNSSIAAKVLLSLHGVLCPFTEKDFEYNSPPKLNSYDLWIQEVENLFRNDPLSMVVENQAHEYIVNDPNFSPQSIIEKLCKVLSSLRMREGSSTKAMSEQTLVSLFASISLSRTLLGILKTFNRRDFVNLESNYIQFIVEIEQCEKFAIQYILQIPRYFDLLKVLKKVSPSVSLPYFVQNGIMVEHLQQFLSSKTSVASTEGLSSRLSLSLVSCCELPDEISSELAKNVLLVCDPVEIGYLKRLVSFLDEDSLACVLEKLTHTNPSKLETVLSMVQKLPFSGGRSNWSPYSLLCGECCTRHTTGDLVHLSKNGYSLLSNLMMTSGRIPTEKELELVEDLLCDEGKDFAIRNLVSTFLPSFISKCEPGVGEISSDFLQCVEDKILECDGELSFSTIVSLVLFLVPFVSRNDHLEAIPHILVVLILMRGNVSKEWKRAYLEETVMILDRFYNTRLLRIFGRSFLDCISESVEIGSQDWESISSFLFQSGLDPIDVFLIYSRCHRAFDVKTVLGKLFPVKELSVDLEALSVYLGGFLCSLDDISECFIDDRLQGESLFEIGLAGAINGWLGEPDNTQLVKAASQVYTAASAATGADVFNPHIANIVCDINVSLKEVIKIPIMSERLLGRLELLTLISQIPELKGVVKLGDQIIDIGISAFRFWRQSKQSSGSVVKKCDAIIENCFLYSSVEEIDFSSPKVTQFSLNVIDYCEMRSQSDPLVFERMKRLSEHILPFQLDMAGDLSSTIVFKDRKCVGNYDDVSRSLILGYEREEVTMEAALKLLFPCRFETKAGPLISILKSQMEDLQLDNQHRVWSLYSCLVCDFGHVEPEIPHLLSKSETVNDLMQLFSDEWFPLRARIVSGSRNYDLYHAAHHCLDSNSRNLLHNEGIVDEGILSSSLFDVSLWSTSAIGVIAVSFLQYLKDQISDVVSKVPLTFLDRRTSVNTIAVCLSSLISQGVVEEFGPVFYELFERTDRQIVKDFCQVLFFVKSQLEKDRSRKLSDDRALYRGLRHDGRGTRDVLDKLKKGFRESIPKYPFWIPIDLVHASCGCISLGLFDEAELFLFGQKYSGFSSIPNQMLFDIYYNRHDTDTLQWHVLKTNSRKRLAQIKERVGDWKAALSLFDEPKETQKCLFMDGKHSLLAMIETNQSMLRWRDLDLGEEVAVTTSGSIDDQIMNILRIVERRNQEKGRKARDFFNNKAILLVAEFLKNSIHSYESLRVLVKMKNWLVSGEFDVRPVNPVKEFRITEREHSLALCLGILSGNSKLAFDHFNNLVDVCRSCEQFSMLQAILHRFKTKLVHKLEIKDKHYLIELQLEELRLLAIDEKISAITHIRGLSKKYAGQENPKLELLAEMALFQGEWSMETKSVAPIQNSLNFDRAIGFADKLGETKGAVIYSRVAQFYHALFFERENAINSSGFKDCYDSARFVVQRLDQYKSGPNPKDKQEKRKILKTKREMDLALDELEKTIRGALCERDTYALRAVKYHAKSLLFGGRDSNPRNNTLKIIGLWLRFSVSQYASCENESGDPYTLNLRCESYDSLMCRINSRLSSLLNRSISTQNLSSHFFVPYVHQLISYVENYPSLKDTISQMAIEHPHHVLVPLISLRQTGSAPVTKRGEVVEEILKSICADNSFKRSMKTMLIGYNTFAKLMHDVRGYLSSSVGKSLTSNKVDVFSISKLDKEDLSSIVLPTYSLPVVAPIVVDQDQYADFPRIYKFEQYGYVYSEGVTLPIVIGAYDSHGNLSHLLAKGGSKDVRQSVTTMQVLGEINDLLESNGMTGLETYKIVPLGAQVSIIHMIEDVETLNSILLKRPKMGELAGLYWRYNNSEMTEQEANELYTTTMTNSLENREQAYKSIRNQLPSVFRHWFLENAKDIQRWTTMVKNYVKTTASNSISGFVLGIGDRHLENILMKSDGTVVHIDVDFAFDEGKRLQHPELIPFRLTHNIVDGMGLPGVEGAFRVQCERILKLLVDQQESLITLLNVLLRDPLFDWYYIIETPEDAARAASKAAERAIDTVKNKLSGKVAGIDHLSIQGVIAWAIREAMSDANLSRMYNGWKPWI